MKIVSVVGARPQFVKLFPISRAIPKSITHQVIHTGQHYDDAMSEVFFQELLIDNPVLNLGVGSGSHAKQTAAMMASLEDAFVELNPNVVLVYGDTNSTLAAALVAAKMGINLVHLEAGLRSANRSMPEELNRIVVDHLSDLLLAPTQTALYNLKFEGLDDKTVYIGDVTVDATLGAKQIIENGGLSQQIETPSKYFYCTIHRAENTSTAMRMNEIVKKLSLSETPIIFPMHPRWLDACKKFGINLTDCPIIFLGPQSYLNSIDLIMRSSGVITDSGGMQKEAYLLKRRTLTIRTETEWPETLLGDWNILDNSLDLVNSKWSENFVGPQEPYFGDGQSSFLAMDAILSKFG